MNILSKKAWFLKKLLIKQFISPAKNRLNLQLCSNSAQYSITSLKAHF